MTGLLLLMVGVGAAASHVRRGWMSIPLSLVFPAVPTVLGAFDDGEPLGLIVFWFALWPTLAALGFAVGAIVQRRSSKGLQIAR